MNTTLSFLAAGLGVGAVGGLIFYGGMRLLDRKDSRLGAVGGCLAALLGAVVIFLGLGIAVAGMLAR